MNQGGFYGLIMDFLDKNYPLNKIYQPKISETLQNQVVKDLSNTIKYEQFFFVLNLLNREIEHCHGLSNWLGYRDENFKFIDYVRNIHPRHKDSLNLNALSAIKLSQARQFEVRFMNQKIVAMFPIRHNNGSYFLVKRSLYPFQIDENGLVLAYLNHFVIIKEYTEDDVIEARVGKENVIESPLENAFFSDLKKNEGIGILKKMKLNDFEIEVLKLVNQFPDLTQDELANKMDINAITFKKTNSKRILEKFRTHYNLEKNFTLKDAAQYLKKEGLI
ncbi:MAG: hypothetical protein ACRCVT_07475 [Leadbetterella sp.]